MAITYHGSASTPTTTDGSNSTSPTAIAPPGSMLTGDLVVVICHNRLTSDTHAVSNNGGQSWTKETTYSDGSGLLTTVTLFWCRYNGTWSANPSFSHGGTNNTCMMMVFRPSQGSNTWEIDVEETVNNFAAPTTPFDVVLTGITAGADSVVIGSFSSRDDSTWAMQSSGSWVQSRTIDNLAGQDTGDLTCYILMPSGGSTGNLTGRQTLEGGDTGVRYIMSFKEVAGLTHYYLWTTNGSFTWTRNNAIELWKHLTFTTAGSYIWTRNNSILGSGRKIYTTAGAYTLSGSNAVLKSTRLVKTTAGSFALTGNNAYLLKVSKIYSTTGAFTLSGSNGILKFTRLVKVTAGVYTWVGLDAILTYSAGFLAYKLLTTKGDFVLSGSNAYLRYYRKMFTTVGPFTWTGNNARILAARKTFTTAGSYTLSGSEILAAGRSVRSAAGSFTWTRNNEILLYGRNILGACGSYSLFGSWVIFLIAYQVRTSQGIYTLTGSNAELTIVGAGIKSDGMWVGLFIGMERKEQT